MMIDTTCTPLRLRYDELYRAIDMTMTRAETGTALSAEWLRGQTRGVGLALAAAGITGETWEAFREICSAIDEGVNAASACDHRLAIVCIVQARCYAVLMGDLLRDAGHPSAADLGDGWGVLDAVPPWVPAPVASRQYGDCTGSA